MDANENPIIPEGYSSILEGSTRILYPTNNDVFYNKVQVMNRDLSILMITLYGEILKKEKEELQRAKPSRALGIQKELEEASKRLNDPIIAEDGLSILEALSASGLRSIRYYKEIPGIKRVIANDIADAAVQAIRKNCEFNHVDTRRVVPNQADATLLMYQSRDPSYARFDVVDLDPYGSCSIFLDGAIQSIKDGGMLCVTSTDMTVLCGNHPEVSFSKYGANCPKTSFYNEQAVRILLYSIASVAGRYGKAIEVLGAFQIDFYVRCFVRVHDSKQAVRQHMMKSSLLYYCNDCTNFQLQTLGRTSKNDSKFQPPICEVDSKCNVCKSAYRLGGPVYNGRLCDPEVMDAGIRRLNDLFVTPVPSLVSVNTYQCATHKRLIGLLTAMREEINTPFYFSYPSISSFLRITPPKYAQLQSALMDKGYQVSQAHSDPCAIKTDAPGPLVFDCFRAYFREFQMESMEGTVSERSTSFAKEYLLSPAENTFDFTIKPELLEKKYDFPRFPGNPEPNWGPKSRGSMKRSRTEESKQE